MSAAEMLKDRAMFLMALGVSGTAILLVLLFTLMDAGEVRLGAAWDISLILQLLSFIILAGGVSARHWNDRPVSLHLLLFAVNIALYVAFYLWIVNPGMEDYDFTSVDVALYMLADLPAKLVLILLPDAGLFGKKTRSGPQVVVLDTPRK